MNPNHRFFGCTLAAVLVLVGGLPAAAHEGHHHNAMGTVRAISSAELQLETKDGKREAFVLTDATQFKRNEIAAQRAEVKVGERAVVMYETKAGDNLAIEVKLAKATPTAASSPSPATHARSSAGKPTEAEEAAVLRQVESRFVCMINDALFLQPQIPVEVGGKTYFGCCAMCKDRLAADAESRLATDPVSGRKVDKAEAVIGVLPTGTVLYFENKANLASHRTKLAAGQR